MAVKFMLVVNINGNKKTIVNNSEEVYKKNLSICKDRGYEVIKKTKLYPVGRWETYQHVFYNAHDRAMIAMYDAEESGNAEQLSKSIDWNEKVNDLLDKFDCGFQDANGMVYMEYKDYKVAKDIIGGYAWRHNGTV